MSVTFNIGSQNAEKIYNVAGNLNITQNSPADDVSKVVDAIAARITELNLPDKESRKALNRLAEAKDEIQSDTPDKNAVAKSLNETAEVLKATKTAADQLKALVPYAAQVGAWLGTTAASLGFTF